MTGRSQRELLLDAPDESASAKPRSRRPCDRCGKPLPSGEPARAVRLPSGGGYSIEHQRCGRGLRRRRSPAIS
jgi:hypothetical protein